MARPFLPLRRLAAAALLALAALALVPVAAQAATPGYVRLLDTDPEYKDVTITTVDGKKVTAAPGLLKLRVNPVGASQADRRGFCVDLHHVIDTGKDYSVSLRTAADDALLASPRYAEAAWLIQNAEALIAAAAPSARGLEAGALQVAVWQLAGEARETNPTSDTALNARAAAVRALAAGKRIGGAVTATPEMAKGCAVRGSVKVHLTGAPASTATVAVTSGPGVVSASSVTFDAKGAAVVTLSSPRAGASTVTVTSAGGALTRLARAKASQSTPQETMVLVPSTHTATATVTFEDCPLVPLEEGPTTPTTPTTPVTPSETPDAPKPATPADTPVTPFETPSSAPAQPTTPADATPRRPHQATPDLRLRKSGPSRIAAGARATYVIKVTNRGTSAARGIQVTDRLPDGMSLAAVPSGARLRSGAVVWALSPLAPGATRTLTVRVRLDADVSGRRCNKASLTVPGGPARSASACTRVTPLTRVLLPAVTA
ncbi:MAG: hypothetical protein AB7V62_13310 [Thermoleophilia bacterium]